MRATDWKDEIVGNLRVTARVAEGLRDKNGDILWIAKCICGKEKKISSRQLRDARRNGTVASCGCSSGVKRRTDWSNKKIGRLTFKRVVGNVSYPSGGSSPVWEAICECGGKREIAASEIRNAMVNGSNLSCENCPRAEALELIGERIGSVIVGQPTGKHIWESGGAAPLFSCRCDCGNSKLITSSTLRQARSEGYNLSCGCVLKEKHEQFLGKQIGWLKVHSRNPNLSDYQCLCRCGVWCTKTHQDLQRAAHTKSQISCGCYFKRVQVGEKFGRLTVIARLESKRRNNGGSRGHWQCKCQCGNEITAETTNLTLGKVKSCGCYREEGEWRFSPAFSHLRKLCPNCNKDLDRREFGKDNNRQGGLKSLCRKCNYKVKDYSKVVVSNILKKEKTRLATPSWVKRKDLERIHAKRLSLENLLNTKLNVDHIVPLVNQNVCGLNVAKNLQITGASYNMSKRNTFNSGTISEIEEESFFEDGVRIHISVFDDAN